MRISDWSSYVCSSDLALRPRLHLRRDDGFAGAEFCGRRRYGGLLFAGVATRKLGIELAQDRQNLRLADLVEEDIRARPPVFGGIDFEQRAKLGLEAVRAIAAGGATLKALTDGKRQPCCLFRFVGLPVRPARRHTFSSV